MLKLSDRQQLLDVYWLKLTIPTIHLAAVVLIVELIIDNGRIISNWLKKNSDCPLSQAKQEKMKEI